MDKLSAMRAFVEIAERGSLTAAATALGKAQPTIVRTLANLEDTLGVRLLRRTTRRLSLTEEGRAYLDRCKQILADIDEAEQIITGGQGEPHGELRVTAPVTFGQWHVAPALFSFLARYQAVQVELLLLDRVVNFLEEGIDLAVRIGELADSSMIAVPVGHMRQVVVGAPGLLQRSGVPETPAALQGAPAIVFRGLSSRSTWRFQRGDDKWAVDVNRTFVTNQAVAAVSACAAGLGYGRFLAYQVAPWLADGRLEVLLQDYEPPPSPVSLLYTDARLMTPRLRVLLDHLKSALGTTLASEFPLTEPGMHVGSDS